MSEGIEPYWNNDQTIDGETYYRIPGRDYDRGEITHKLVSQMNRQERRALNIQKPNLPNKHKSCG